MRCTDKDAILLRQCNLYSGHPGPHQTSNEKDRFWIHVVYKHPKDYPNSYVIRRQSPNPDGSILVAMNCIVASTLDQARKILEGMVPGLFRIDRDPSDDPVIVESWI